MLNFLRWLRRILCSFFPAGARLWRAALWHWAWGSGSVPVANSQRNTRHFRSPKRSLANDPLPTRLHDYPRSHCTRLTVSVTRATRINSQVHIGDNSSRQEAKSRHAKGWRILVAPLRPWRKPFHSMRILCTCVWPMVAPWACRCCGSRGCPRRGRRSGCGLRLAAGVGACTGTS